MPEYNFYCYCSERPELLEWIVANGAQLVPHLHYEHPEYTTISSPNELATLAQVDQIWVLRSDWQRENLDIGPIVNRYLGPGFVIASRAGGPAIQLLLSHNRPTDPPYLLDCCIQHYPYYYTLAGREPVPAPDALREFYSAVVKLIRQRSRRMTLARISRWITEKAIAEVVGGRAIKPTAWEKESDLVGARRRSNQVL
jgi:hypothetical protein